MRRLLLMVAFLLTMGISYGQSNYAAVFNNSNYATVATSTVDQNFTTGTVELWAKPNAIQNANCLFSIRSGSTAATIKFGFHLMMLNKTIDFWNGNGTTTTRSLSYPFVSGVWYHFAFVIKASTTDVYINGVLLGTFTQGKGTGTTTNIGIGCAGYNAELFSGSIDEVRLWNTQRTQADILANMNKTLTLPQTGLIGYWNFDDMGSSTTSTLDLSGNNTTAASFTNTTTVEKIVPSIIPITSCAFSQSIVGNLFQLAVSDPEATIAKVEYYNGNTKIGETSVSPYTFNAPVLLGSNIYSAKFYDNSNNSTTSNTLTIEGLPVANNYCLKNTATTSAAIPANTAFSLASGGTISLWMCPNGTTTTYNPGLIANRATVSSKVRSHYDFELLKDYSGIGLYIGTDASTPTFTWKQVAYPFQKNKWYHIAFVVNVEKNDVEAYVNGDYVGNFGQGLGTAANQAIAIGAEYAATGCFPGKIDEVQIWSIQKTASQIKAEMFTQPTPSTTGLEGYWRFNSIVPTVIDYSGNGRNGTYNYTATASSSYGAGSSIKITSPSTGTSFNSSNPIPVTVDIQSPYSSITKVEYFNGTTSLGTTTTAPYSFTISTEASATTNLDLTAVLTYDAGETIFSNRVALQNSNFPTVSITNLVDNQNCPISGVPITVSATDNGSIAKVAYYVSSPYVINSSNTYSFNCIGESTSSPYTFNYVGVTGNTYLIQAVATDNQGNASTSKAVLIRINKAPTTATITTNKTVVSVNMATTLTMTGTDADGTIVKVELYKDGAKLTDLTTSPFTYNFTPTTLGTNNFYAIAYDNLGASTTSTSITVTAKTVPTATVTSPTTNTTYTNPSLIYLEATTAVNTSTTISTVKLYDNVTLLGTAAIVSTGVYSFNWTSNFVVGTRSITAVVTDADGLIGTSSAINVIVSTQVPTATITGTDATATIKAPANFVITVSATDPDGTISKIIFYDGVTYLGQTLSIGNQVVGATTIYTFQATGITGGTRNLIAIAVDNYSATGTSAIYTVNVAGNVYPTITLTTNPAATTSPFKASSVAISYTTNDTDDGLYKVDVYKNGTIYTTNILNTTAGTSTTLNFVLPTTVAGAYTIMAIATDKVGATTTTNASFTVAAYVAPTVSITAPTNNVVVLSGTSVAVTVTATDTDGDGAVANVTLYNGTTQVGTTVTAPYTFNFTPTTAGTFTLKAIATDVNGLTGSSSVAVIGNTLPTVSITSATNTTVILGTTVNVSVTATDNGTIANVKLFEGTTQVGTTLTASPYEFSLTTLSIGTHYLVAVATDNNGGVGSSSAVTILVTNTTNSKPVVTLTQTTVGKVVTLSATANDTDGSISNVVFYDGTTALGTATVASSTSVYTFQTSNLAVGTHSITAVATDNSNETTVSNAVSVIITSVDNQTSNLEVKFYPNPFKSILNVEVNGAFEYTIVDLKGSVIEKGIARDKAEIGSNIQSGFYLLNIKQNGTSKTVKIEKQ